MGISIKIGLAFLTLASLAMAADKIRVGTVPGAYGDSIEAAAKEAKKYGIEVEVIEFTDGTTPNIATDKGDIDLNYHQHEPYLNNAIKENGYKLTPIGWGSLANIGLYSTKYKSLDDIPIKGKVAVANDPVNQGRGLLLLQKAGLIKLKNGGGDQSTLEDIVENPKNLHFIGVELMQIVRAIDDVDIGVTFPHYVAASGAFDPSSALLWGGIEDRKYTIRFVVPTAKKDDPVLHKFVKIYQTSEAVREALKKGFNNDARLYTLTWVEDEKNEKETKK
ncbi:MAG: MetQ/NlpA family ABC transporter substrate-binding protein [Campylobacteraceae bacterium]|jgi:D-methionine transport system substrate-binding protein|nr:MetQ/NlpA family ABC transporter substrate-binding protein [Campylobacteraceae bacterium]